MTQSLNENAATPAGVTAFAGRCSGRLLRGRNPHVGGLGLGLGMCLGELSIAVFDSELEAGLLRLQGADADPVLGRVAHALGGDADVLLDGGVGAAGDLDVEVTGRGGAGDESGDGDQTKDAVQFKIPFVFPNLLAAASVRRRGQEVSVI